MRAALAAWHRCAAGVERLTAAVAPYDATTAAAIAGVGPEELEQLDALVAARRADRHRERHRRDDESQRQPHRVDGLGLAAVTDSLDRRGGVTFNAGSLRRIEDGVPGGRGDLGPRPSSRPDLPRLVNGEVPCAALADEIRAGQVRALIVRVGNPALAIAGQPALREALGELDVLVSIEARPSETTALATHVLPMADHFERGDVLWGYLQADPFLRWVPAVVEPVGERRPQWWIVAELAERLGLAKYGSRRRDARFADGEIDVDDAVIAESLLANARRTWDEVIASPYGIRDTSVPPGWLVPDRLPQPLDLAPVELVEQLAGTSTDPAPLVLINRRTPQQYNTLHREVTGRGRPANPALLVHPFDASARGLAHGETAILRTALGECRAVVEIDRGDPPGRGVRPPRLRRGQRQPDHLHRRRRPTQRDDDHQRRSGGAQPSRGMTSAASTSICSASSNIGLSSTICAPASITCCTPATTSSTVPVTDTGVRSGAPK